MPYIAFASAKGSPGVTTTVAALAATWPQDRPLLVVEADPAGGDLAVRFDLAAEPGLVSLAAAGRRELNVDVLVEHSQPLVSLGGQGAPPKPQHRAGVPDNAAARRILAGPVSADQARAALVSLGRRLGGALRDVPMDVLVDCGRLDQSAAVRQLASDADLLVLVARPVVAEVHHLTNRVKALEGRVPSLLLVGDRPYTVDEVAGVAGAAPLGTLPEDRRGAAPLSVGHPDGLRALKRSRLLRSARVLADSMASWLGPSVPGDERLALPPGDSQARVGQLALPPAESVESPQALADLPPVAADVPPASADLSSGESVPAAPLRPPPPLPSPPPPPQPQPQQWDEWVPRPAPVAPPPVGDGSPSSVVHRNGDESRLPVDAAEDGGR